MSLEWACEEKVENGPSGSLFSPRTQSPFPPRTKSSWLVEMARKPHSLAILSNMEVHCLASFALQFWRFVAETQNADGGDANRQN